MERRIAKLEDAYRPGVDRALLERIAAENDIDPDELLFEAEAIAEDMERHLPKPHTIGKMAAYLAARDGLTAAERDQLIADGGNAADWRALDIIQRQISLWTRACKK